MWRRRHELMRAWNSDLWNGLLGTALVMEKGRDRARDSDGRSTVIDWRMPQSPDDSPDDGRFRRNLVRVMSVQVVALVLLWLLQHRYSR